MESEEKKVEKPEDKKPETAEAGVVAGSEPKTTTLVDDANAAAERLEKANERKAELLRQEQDLEARKVLGGETEGPQVEEKKEETPAEYAKRISEGKL